MFSFSSSKKSCCSIEAIGEKNAKESNCCQSPKPKSKVNCPLCGNEAKGVLAKTLDALLQESIKKQLSQLEGFSYCKSPSCKAIYFRDGMVITQEGVKVTVGIKEWAKPATLCYCFAWSKEKIQEQLEKHGKSDVVEDIKAKMQNPGCFCEVSNPSGGCCLADVKKALKELESDLE